MKRFPKRSLEDWQSLAEKELKGRSPDDLVWETPEGIAVNPLYSAEDLAGVEHLESLPGMAPFVRGPRCLLYTSDAADE